MATISTACDIDDKRRGFMTSIQRDKFDQENARDGIHIGEIERIAKRCKVKTSKYGTLPADGYYSCLEYVRKYANSPKDVDTFIDMWKITVQKQQNAEADKIKDDLTMRQQYHNWNIKSKRHAKEMVTTNPLTFEITHWRGLDKEIHQKRVQDVADTSVMSRILAQPPIIRWSSVVPDARTEFWTINGRPTQTINTMSKRNFEKLYDACCAHCGYDSKL